MQNRDTNKTFFWGEGSGSIHNSLNNVDMRPTVDNSFLCPVLLSHISIMYDCSLLPYEAHRYHCIMMRKKKRKMKKKKERNKEDREYDDDDGADEDDKDEEVHRGQKKSPSSVPASITSNLSWEISAHCACHHCLHAPHCTHSASLLAFAIVSL